MTVGSYIAQATLDPTAVYDVPGDVLVDPGLSDAQRIEILRRWSYDAREVSVAEDEGMAHFDGVTLDQVLQALHKLVPHIDTSSSPPTKQGGPDRAAVTPARSET